MKPKSPRVYPSVSSLFDMHRADLRDHSSRLHRDLDSAGEEKIKRLSHHADSLLCEMQSVFERLIAELEDASDECVCCPHCGKAKADQVTEG